MCYQSSTGPETGHIKCHHWPEKLAIFPRSSFYERFSIVFLLMLLIITIRFYDFLEASLFRSMTRQQKLRFLLYILSTVGQLYKQSGLQRRLNVFLEAMFDFSLVALNLEILLELSLVIYQEVKLWIIYVCLAGGLPITFLFLYIIVWESS